MNADNAPNVALTGSLPVIGMTPPPGILRSTKPHHDKWTEHGYQNSIANFWSRVQPDEATGCWIWSGARTEQNYGRCGGSPYWYEMLAHRRAWEMLRGRPAPKSSGLELDHLCHHDDPTCTAGKGCPHRPCVNPEHLRECSIDNRRRQNEMRAQRRAS